MSKNKFKKKELQLAIRKIFERQSDQKQSVNSIITILGVRNKNLKKHVFSILKNLKDEGFIYEYQTNHFILDENYKTSFVGVIDATSRGTAYVVVDGMEQDIYISNENMANALDGDTVEVSIIRRSKRKIEGAVTKIIERKSKHFVGTIEVHKKFAFLKVEDAKINIDLYIPLEKLKGAKSGEKAVGRITSWPKNLNNPYGEIVQVLGLPGTVETEMESILIKHNFDSSFPKDVVSETKNIRVELTEDDIANRKDFREVLTYTIDPINAKDFDDALSFRMLASGNYEVGVHIADVSYYVKSGSAIDKEALKRGNSVYLEDRVVPMLPEQLSNVVCSLRPNEDKLTFSAVFEVNKEGKVISEWFGKTIICSNHRYNYKEIQAIIEGAENENKESIVILNSIAQKLRKKRIEKGAMAIESEEISFVLNEKSEPIGVEKRVQLDAHKLIEEFMLLANKRVAIFIGKLPENKGSNYQFIFRCHDKPEIEKLNTFSVFVEKFGYELNFKNINSVAQQINSFLKSIKDSSEYGLMQTMAIRSMSKADYRTGNIGHYGLAFDYYTHFTSPIRRYADLTVHRLLMDKLTKAEKNYGNQLNEICKHISAQERKAIEAERESNKFFQAKYMNDKIGQQFEGTVSGITDFGMFVKMNENYCEGMVSIHSLPDDSYFYDANKFQIVGRHTRYTFNFGDKVLVKIAGVDLLKKQIELKLIKTLDD